MDDNNFIWAMRLEVFAIWTQNYVSSILMMSAFGAKAVIRLIISTLNIRGVLYMPDFRF